MPYKKLGVALVAALLMVVALVLGRAWWLSDDGPERLVLSGNIELTQVSVGFKLPGKIVQLNFEEGQTVEEGALLALLDDTQLQRQRRQTAAGLQAARSRRAELRAELVFQRENIQARIEQRTAELAEARAGLEAALAGSRPQEIEQLRAAVARAESFYGKALSDWERARKLTVEKDISRSQFEDFRAAFEAAAADLEAARERLALGLEGPRQEDIAAARARVARAQAALKQANSLRLEIKRLEQSIETTRAEVERADAQLAQVESQLDDTRLTSPLSGIVLVKSAEAGEVLPLGVPIATIGDLARPWMRAYIPASALGRIRLGQTATVKTDSYPDKTYQGRIVFIAEEAEFTPKQIQTPDQRSRLVYRIKIQLENTRQELKLNMPCEAEVQLSAESGAAVWHRHPGLDSPRGARMKRFGMTWEVAPHGILPVIPISDFVVPQSVAGSRTASRT